MLFIVLIDQRQFSSYLIKEELFVYHFMFMLFGVGRNILETTVIHFLYNATYTI